MKGAIMRVRGYLRDCTVKTAAAADNVQKRTLTLKIEGIGAGEDQDGVGEGLVGYEVQVNVKATNPKLPLDGS